MWTCRTCPQTRTKASSSTRPASTTCTCCARSSSPTGSFCDGSPPTWASRWRSSRCMRQLALTGGRSTTSALARELGVDPAAVTRLVADLETLELVTRERDARDGRRRPVVLTERGRRETVTLHAAPSPSVKAASRTPWTTPTSRRPSGCSRRCAARSMSARSESGSAMSAEPVRRRWDQRAFVVMGVALCGLALPITGLVDHVAGDSTSQGAAQGWAFTHTAIGGLVRRVLRLARPAQPPRPAAPRARPRGLQPPAAPRVRGGGGPGRRGARDHRHARAGRRLTEWPASPRACAASSRSGRIASPRCSWRWTARAARHAGAASPPAPSRPSARSRWGRTVTPSSSAATAAQAAAPASRRAHRRRWPLAPSPHSRLSSAGRQRATRRHPREGPL